MGKNKLWKLKTTVYGLCDAPRVWYISVKEVLLKAGAEKSKFDDSIFFWHRNVKVQRLICCHADDFFWGSTNDFEKSVIQKLRENFVTSPEECESCKYLGLKIVQKNHCIYLDQKLYIEEIKEVAIDTKRKMSKEAQLTTGEAWQLRGIAGQLNGTSSQMRPDMSFCACKISTSIKDATISDLIHAKKISEG